MVLLSATVAPAVMHEAVLRESLDMDEKHEPMQATHVEDLAMANLWELAALVELLQRKGVLTKQELQDTILELRGRGRNVAQPDRLRSGRRVPVRCPIAFAGDTGQGEGVVVDLSQTGWRVKCDFPVRKGAYMSLRVALPDGAPPLVVDQGVVRWARQGEFGLEFLVMQAEAQKRLSAFLATLTAGVVA